MYIDKMDDPQHTMGFSLKLVTLEGASFDWPAFAWPFRVRNKRVHNFIKHGANPHVNFLRTINDVNYHFKIDGGLYKYDKQIDSAEGKGFSYFPHNNPSAKKGYQIDEWTAVEELYSLFYNSFPGATFNSNNFKIRIFAVIKRQRVYLEEDLNTNVILQSDTIIGHTIRDSLMVAVPTSVFKSFTQEADNGTF